MKGSYDKGYFSFHFGKKNAEKNLRFNKLLLNQSFIYEKSQNIYKLTPKGMFPLAEYAIAEKPILLLHNKTNK